MSATKTDALKGALLKTILALAFVGIGTWVVFLAIDMVGIFGEGMGVDARSREIYKHAHIAVHLFGTASSVAVGLFLMGKHRFLATAAVLAIIACGGYGIINMIGFTTTNRLSVSASRDAANSAEWKKFDLARDAIKGNIEWAHKTLTEEDSPREKRRQREYIDQQTAKLNALEPPKPTADKVLADPQATWFSKLSGLNTETWQLALPVPVAILLFAAEVLSFVFAMHFLVGAVGDFRMAQKTPDNSSGSAGSATGGSGGSSGPKGGSKGGSKVEPPKLVPVPTEPKVAQPQHASRNGSAASAQAIEAKVRSMPSGVFSTDAPNRKLSRAQVYDQLRRQHAGSEPRQSTYQIARRSDVPQRTVARWDKRLREQSQAKAHMRRFAGNGGGRHAPTVG